MMSPQNTEIHFTDGHFRLIKGIAETTEVALHKYGIDTFDDLSKMSPEEIAAALPGNVGVKERAARQDWMGQAATFARLLSEQRPSDEVDEMGERLHYASFHIDLLIDEEGNVRRTKVTNIQNKEQVPDRWAGWDPQRMAGWMVEQAGISTERIASQSPQASNAWTEQEDTHSPEVLSGYPEFNPIELISIASKRPLPVIYTGDPFAASISMDLSQITSMPGINIQYQAVAIVRRLADGKQVAISQVDGVTYQEDRFPLEIPFQGLSAGSYHLDVAVKISPPASKTPEQDSLNAITEGVLFRVVADDPLPARVDKSYLPKAIGKSGLYS